MQDAWFVDTCLLNSCPINPKPLATVGGFAALMALFTSPTHAMSTLLIILLRYYNYTTEMVLLILLLEMVSEYTITLEPTNKTLSQKVLASCQISGYDILVEFGGHFLICTFLCWSHVKFIDNKIQMVNRQAS
jgi:hypothetical protein